MRKPARFQERQHGGGGLDPKIVEGVQDIPLGLGGTIRQSLTQLPRRFANVFGQRAFQRGQARDLPVEGLLLRSLLRQGCPGMRGTP